MFVTKTNRRFVHAQVFFNPTTEGMNHLEVQQFPNGHHIDFSRKIRATVIAARGNTLICRAAVNNILYTQLEITK